MWMKQTVLKPNKIAAAKDKRNVGAMTSGERGTNVTMVTAVSAFGNTVPPMFVFPRKNFKSHFVNGSPSDCIGAGNASGWVTDAEFFQFIQHFIKHVKPPNEHRVLLVLDNHSSHLHVETLNLAKEDGSVIDDEFFPSFITDRPDPESVQLEKDPSDPAVMHAREPDSATASTNQAGEEAGTSYKENVHFNPSRGFSLGIVRPYPKAGPRKIGRRKRKAAILTDTPKKNALQEKLYKTTIKSSEESNKDYYACLVCCEVYSESLSGEKWIQCQICKEWAHTKCAPNAGLTYVCINCNNDNDD
ncbi:hypothetical protein ILUMI_19072 [Ignelater luminosus]|uniref:DDE-1 domain-containing protein n=1 Tax=Ignelater luminosus TaxID=2038154 RepID=A0A8K0G5X7_IGNLU|nr:hypothetical protein ILUMI_19072 [Ignelater luminosus]